MSRNRRSFWDLAGNSRGDQILNKRFGSGNNTPDIVKIREVYGDATERLKRARKFTNLIQKIPGVGEALQFVAEIPVDATIGYTSIVHDISGELIDLAGNTGESYADYKKKISLLPPPNTSGPNITGGTSSSGSSGSITGSGYQYVPVYVGTGNIPPFQSM